MIIETNIDLGVEYECVITGFRGVATAFVTYISGCDQVCLDPGMDKEGNRGKIHYVDVNSLRLPLTNPKSKIVLPDTFVSRKLPSKSVSVNSPAGGPSRYEPPAR